MNAEDQKFSPQEDQNFHQDWSKISNWYAFWWHDSADQNFSHPGDQNFIHLEHRRPKFFQLKTFSEHLTVKIVKDNQKVRKHGATIIWWREAPRSHLPNWQGGTKVFFRIDETTWNNTRTTTPEEREKIQATTVEDRINSDSEKSINYSELTQKWHWTQKLYWKVIVTWMDIDWRILWTTRIYGTIVNNTTQIVGTGQAMSKLFHNFFHAELFFLNHIIVFVTICTCCLLLYNWKQKFENHKNITKFWKSKVVSEWCRYCWGNIFPELYALIPGNVGT